MRNDNVLSLTACGEIGSRQGCDILSLIIFSTEHVRTIIVYTNCLYQALHMHGYTLRHEDKYVLSLYYYVNSDAL